jgi:hypothetical protein
MFREWRSSMKRLLRSAIGLAVGFGLCVSVAAPALAGYGNHAERATEKIQTRVGIAKLYLELEAAELRAIGEQRVPTAP